MLLYISVHRFATAAISSAALSNHLPKALCRRDFDLGVGVQPTTEFPAKGKASVSVSTMLGDASEISSVRGQTIWLVCNLTSLLHN